MFLSVANAASVAIIDFDSKSPNNGKYYNSFADYVRNNDNTLSLNSTSGASTGWTVTSKGLGPNSISTGQFLTAATWQNASAAAKANAANWANSLGLTSTTDNPLGLEFGCWSDFLWPTGDDVNTLQFSGLNTDMTYAISIGIGRSSNIATVPITLNAGNFESGYYFSSNSDGVTTFDSWYGSASNIGNGNQRVITYYIKPDESGQIAISIKSGSNAGVNFATISEVIPEPGTASLVLLALATTALRHRKQ